jgi:hypothetical protein
MIGAVFRSALLGPSSLRFSEPGPDASTPTLIREYIARECPDLEHELDTPLLMYGARMAEIAGRAVARADYGAVVVVLGTNNFEQDYVVYAVRRRWPKLYPLALKIADSVNKASGYGMDGGPGLRGELFRTPKRAGLALIGGEPNFSMAQAATWMTEAMDAILAKSEGTPVAIALHPTSHDRPMRKAQERVDAYSQIVRDYCRSKRITLLSRLDYCRDLGVTIGRAPGAAYSNRITRETDAKVIGDFILEAAGRRNPTTPK